MNKLTRFLLTTAIGGILFLLPLIVLGALIGQAVPIVLAVAEALGKVIPVRTPSGIALLIALAVGVVLLLCFGAGLLARRSWGKRISAWFEKNLVLLFPRYTIIREQMAGSIGRDIAQPSMKAVMTTIAETRRLGFEIERNDQGFVTVYLPGSPDPWTGDLVFLEAQRVQPLDIEFGDAMATFEKLGRDSVALPKLRE